MKKVFIDGSAGTTGLRIRERLAQRRDLEVVTLPEELRKDVEARRQALNGAVVAFLCLPDATAIEAVSLVENPETVIIDTSTAHRTADGWEYGFPELEGRRARLAQAKRIANPGCHASGFVALVEPLVRAGLVAADEPLCAFSLTGYSGGGKKMIAEYDEQVKEKGEGEQQTDRSSCFAFTSDLHIFAGGRQYALGQAHKHLPEMVKICGLKAAPCFSPIVVPHLSGMEVTVQLFGKDLSAIKDCYRSYYGSRDQGLIAPPANGDTGVSASPLADRSRGDSGVSASPLADRGCGLVRFVDDPAAAEGGFLSSAALSGKDTLEVSAYGNGERVILVSRFDNLGKGASGAAIQNMNVVLGVDETMGLVV